MTSYIYLKCGCAFSVDENIWTCEEICKEHEKEICKEDWEEHFIDEYDEDDGEL